MFDNNHYNTLKPARAGYYLLILVAAALLLAGLYAAYITHHAGHHITGMNNHVVWGLPHVFAISLILAASGALNAASMSSVFGSSLYKPYARLAIALAIALLAGGLMVLVLDLGRPDRLIVAMTHYNFRSIFAWNIFLYTGFMAIGLLYQWVLMERRHNRHVKLVGRLAFGWRIVLTTGTGCIFGFLVGRNALDTALMAPLFISLSLAFGTAAFAISLLAISRWQSAAIRTELTASIRKLLVWFVVAVAYFSIVHHVSNLYVAEHHLTERHILSGEMSKLFWGGHILLGSIVPLWLLLTGDTGKRSNRLLLACVAVIAGCTSLVYVIVIGSQSTPQQLFPGHTVLSSRFGDAGFATYAASLWEWALGLGGVSAAVLLGLVAMRVIPVTPVVDAGVQASE